MDLSTYKIHKYILLIKIKVWMKNFNRSVLQTILYLDVWLFIYFHFYQWIIKFWDVWASNCYLDHMILYNIILNRYVRYSETFYNLRIWRYIVLLRCIRLTVYKVWILYYVTRNLLTRPSLFPAAPLLAH